MPPSAALKFDHAQAIGQKERTSETVPHEDRLYEVLHEELANSVRGEDRDWRVLLSLLKNVGALKGHLQNVDKVHLFRVLNDALNVENLDRVPEGAALPTPRTIVPDLDQVRPKLIAIMFRRCLRQWRLRWAIRLLTLESSELSAKHLALFFHRWKRSIASAPEFISYQAEFHANSKIALDRFFDSLPERDFFEALELLHSPVLTLLGGEQCGTDELFDRWTRNNLHTIAIESIDATTTLGRPANKPRARREIQIPSIQKFATTLANIRSRTDRSVLWISFIEMGSRC